MVEVEADFGSGRWAAAAAAAAAAAGKRDCSQSAVASASAGKAELEAFLVEIVVDWCWVEPWAADSAQWTRRSQ